MADGAPIQPDLLAPANFSPCRRYRYTLARDLDPPAVDFFGKEYGLKGIAAWLGLNPSKADEHRSDPTCTREMNFTRAWGYRRYLKGNLFAWCDTDPRGMKAAADPIGPDNDAWLREIAAAADIIVFCWGTHGGHLARNRAVLELLLPWADKVHVLKLTAGGHPQHPLYLPAHLVPQPCRDYITAPP